ncbi:expressed unknown protein [Seminavis robusta]|uniref:Uncharacterized protein n=1 Tax=Seminavis robusta TaxID=568900 RepID=A0A9N8EAN0_9STRA|nr:expressed unknown protein [Seminavis robusta]|eukprot:Sro734_g194770.1 n/a (252) ;mRNA; f:43265-44020
MIAKPSHSEVDRSKGRQSPSRNSGNQKKTKVGSRLRAMRLNRKLVLMLHESLRAATAKEDALAAAAAPSSKFSLQHVGPPPPSPTAFPRLPDPAIRVAYEAKLQDPGTRVADEQEHDGFVLVGSDSDVDEMQDSQRTPSIKFQPVVQVVEIPSHEDYCESDRKKQWNSKKRIRKEARRNRLEYKADRFDWRNCKEEEDMVELCDGSLVHPHTYAARLSAAGDESCLSMRTKLGLPTVDKVTTKRMMLWQRE